MVAAGFDNLIAAGRCVSCVDEAYASMRVQGTCMAIGGQSAGFFKSAGVGARHIQHTATGAHGFRHGDSPWVMNDKTLIKH